MAYEESKTARRQTPFTKCEIRWTRAVAAGDVVRARRWVVAKYTRRGSRFVTFRVAATRNGEPVGEYDYTCIFDYAKGQRDDANAPPRASSPTARVAAETGEWAGFDIGAAVPPVTIVETQESLNAQDALRLVGERVVGSNIHTDETFARASIFGSTVASGPSMLADVNVMLDRISDAQALYRGGRLTLRAITPFRVGDAVTFAGVVRAIERGRATLEVRGTNPSGALVCLAEATLAIG